MDGGCRVNAAAPWRCWCSARADRAEAAAGPPGARPDRLSGRRGGDLVVVELEEVVGRGDQSPFTSACGSAAALKAFDRTVELDLTEDRLDGDLSVAIQAAAFGRRQGAAHEVIKAAVPTGPGALAQAAVGRHKDLNAIRDDMLDLALMPVAGIGDHDLRVRQSVAVQLASGRGDHRFQMPEVR